MSLMCMNRVIRAATGQRHESILSYCKGVSAVENCFRSQPRDDEMYPLSPPSNRRGRASWLNVPAREPVPPRVPAGWVRWLILALLGGYLLFCHGCHGD